MEEADGNEDENVNQDLSSYRSRILTPRLRSRSTFLAEGRNAGPGEAGIEGTSAFGLTATSCLFSYGFTLELRVDICVARWY